MEPESNAYGRAMVHCVRCPTSAHRACIGSVEHTMITARTYLCRRCASNTPKGLNAPDPWLPKGAAKGILAGAAPVPPMPSALDDDKLARVSLGNFQSGKGLHKLGGRKGGDREPGFELPDSLEDALRAHEVLPTPYFQPPPYATLRRSVYNHSRPREKLDEDDVMVCSCSAVSGGCDERCHNRAMQHECNPSTCPMGQLCSNRPFSTLGPANTLPLQLFKTFDKGWGVMATRDLDADELVVEYVGEVIDRESWEARKRDLWRFDHMYFMALNGDEIVDASRKGNIARFINHSCEPSLQVEKWYVNRVPRLGLWTKRPIRAGEELTYNYSVKWHGNRDHAQRCYCGAPSCTGYMGRPPK